jgi:hypothetical protein
MNYCDRGKNYNMRGKNYYNHRKNYSSRRINYCDRGKNYNMRGKNYSTRSKILYSFKKKTERPTPRCLGYIPVTVSADLQSVPIMIRKK